MENFSDFKIGKVFQKENLISFVGAPNSLLLVKWWCAIW
jgi:hypothetical protein